MTKDGMSMCSISARGIGHFTGPGKVAFRGADLYNAEATGELSFLSNMGIVFEGRSLLACKNNNVEGLGMEIVSHDYRQRSFLSY